VSIIIDYFFTLSSPYTYMGHERFEELAKRHGLTVNYRPANYGKVFSVSGGLPVKQRAQQRQAYRFMELKRWRDHLDIPLNLEPKFFPVNDQLAARIVLAAVGEGTPPGPLMAAFLRAVWAEERDIADPDTLRAIADETGLDGGKLQEAGEAGEITQQQEDFTQEAIDRGVFGAPTWILNDELFWGQDRLDFLERAIEKAGG
jgi:2-hydroxychromene-2-carboxylate isomerase